MIKVAVIGAGAWGANLIRVFRKLGVLGLICDINKNTLRIQSKKFPGIKTADSAKKVFQAKDIKAVVIATPPNTHYLLAKQALLSQKDVFVEKPLSLRLQEVAELAKLVKRSKKILMVGHILHFHPAVIRLKQLIREGALGKILYIYSNRLNMGKLRKDENILWSFAPHDVSCVLMLLDAFPTEVSSFGGKYIQKDVYDTTITNLNFSGGVKAHIFVSWLHPFKEQKLVVVGDKKMAVFDDSAKEKLFLYPHVIKWNGRVPMAVKAKRVAVPMDREEPLKVECRHFLDCVINKTVPKTDINEGLRVFRVLSAAEMSLYRQGEIISLQRNMEAKHYFAHPSSYIDEDVKIGKGTKIWHFSHILKNTKIGSNCTIGQNVMIGPDVTVGNGCKIQNNVSVYKGVTLEDDVFVGPSAVFTNVRNPRAFISRRGEFKMTAVGRGATIGAKAVVVCGHSIGKFAFVGAGTVLTGDVPGYGLVYGNPGRLKGWMCRCGIRLAFKGQTAICRKCKKRYRKAGVKIEPVI